MKKFNVINWDFNESEPSAYDIMPYFIEEYNYDKKEKRKLPQTFEEFKEWIERKSIYMYYSRCQYEIIIKRWPPTEEAKKIDIHKQIMMNIDLVAETLIKNIKE